MITAWGDERCHRGEHDERVVAPGGSQFVERVLESGWIGQQERTLAEVVQHEPRQHDGKPGGPDREAPEVPHVGVKRLAAGDREEDRREHGQRGHGPGLEDVGDRVVRAYGREHAGGLMRSPASTRLIARDHRPHLIARVRAPA